MNIRMLIRLCALFISAAHCLTAQTTTITDFVQLTKYNVASILVPNTLDELRTMVITAQKPIAIAGARFSHGGHIAYPNGTVIDMTKLKAITHFDKTKKQITVQSGATWRRIQKYIDRYNLAISVMQSYNDFSVGGSLSVNVHGRDTTYGQIIETIENIKVMLADGSIVQASRTENADLFAGIIGGYGALGIIIEATINLVDNVPMELVLYHMNATEYSNFFFKNIHNNPDVILHNANLYPSSYDDVVSIAWKKPKLKTRSKEINVGVRKRQARYPTTMMLEQLVRRISPLKTMRPDIEFALRRFSSLETRNYQMSYSVNMHQPITRLFTTTILQEYFVPQDTLDQFIEALQYIHKQYAPNILNASIRYVPKNTESILSYAPENSFAIVLYINILNSSYGTNYAKRWTQDLIDRTLALGGTYYLPYQPYATIEQFHCAYPRWQEFVTIKQKYDPCNVFSNHFILHYLTPKA